MVSGTAVGGGLGAVADDEHRPGRSTAVRGTRASTYFFCARSGGTETSSAAPGGALEDDGVDALERLALQPLTRTREPMRPAVTPMHAGAALRAP